MGNGLDGTGKFCEDETAQQLDSCKERQEVYRSYKNDILAAPNPNILNS